MLQILSEVMNQEKGKADVQLLQSLQELRSVEACPHGVLLACCWDRRWSPQAAGLSPGSREHQ